MYRKLEQAVDLIRTHVARGGRVFFGLDFDGTLAPLSDLPSMASIPGGTAEVLAGLAVEPNVRVAVVSSRGLEDLAERVRIPGVDLVGSHGLELRIDGARTILPGFRIVDPAWTGVVERALQDFPGSWLEVKPAALAVHVRDLGFDRRVELERRLRALPAAAPGNSEGSRWLRCRHTLEWLPPEAGKERGLRVLLQRWGIASGDLLLYAGDDENDAGAMREVRERGGISLGVGPDAPPEAECQVLDPELLTILLRMILRGLRSAHPRVPEPAEWKGGPHGDRPE